MPKTGDVVFSTDQYHPDSIKSMDRERRGCGDKIIVKGESTKKPSDWKAFLGNDENKKQFIRLISKVWSHHSYASKLVERKVILVCEGVAYEYISDGVTTQRNEIQSLYSTQEETDSRIVLYGIYGKEQGYDYIRVKSPDSDIFFILLHQLEGTIVLFETDFGNKQRLLNITELAESYTQRYCSAYLDTYAFTGCDTTSAFKGIGKVKPLKVLQKNPKFVEALGQLGESWNVSTELVDELEKFVWIVYGRSRVQSVDELRYIRIQELCDKEDKLSPSENIDLATFPPCRKSLEQHIRRVNYQVGIWKKASVPDPDIPEPTDGHGWHVIDGKLEPLWFEDDLLPKQLVDILIDAEEEDNMSDSESEEAYSIFDEIASDSSSDE